MSQVLKVIYNIGFKPDSEVDLGLVPSHWLGNQKMYFILFYIQVKMKSF